MSDTSQLKTVQDESADSQKGKKRDRSASEERLIAAGIEIFSKHGYDGSTTKLIAKKADVNESLIGRYFDGKEGLLLTIVERFIEEMRNEELDYPPQENLENELIKYVEFKVGKSHERDCLGKIIICQCLTDNKFRKKALERIPMFADPKLIDRMARFQQKGQIRDGMTLDEIAEEIETYLHGAFLFDLILSETPEEEVVKSARRFIGHYTAGITKS
ncbi:TetR/AcrR family transcriptional regulator [Bdellovibrio bacteriovorus]|uniref:TetR family transcriptional regulator n=1 Tax=Bdellovibrio bacteriovorus TaxID=959 RepID=A0A1Z3N5Q6_BDEBC|nr:TetR/AcrR family transcriptional regulator [Bdellovibrio bacteriovorus]ASD62799.1 TetR family transcriptional regulator [Bdellovibrio bacteriovorus]